VAVDVVFVHGAGLAGVDAWPRQVAEAGAGWRFLPRNGVADDAATDARLVLDWLRPAGGGHVVAHSYGANAALLAAQLEPSLVRSLALLEPACFDLARGMPAVEEHISALRPVLAVAAAMGTEPADLPDGELEARVGRLRALSPPWGVGLRPDQVLPTRTLVVTGGSNPLYEETARALVAAGAQHLTLEGAGHRVQDHPQCTRAVREHWTK